MQFCFILLVNSSTFLCTYIFNSYFFYKAKGLQSFPFSPNPQHMKFPQSARFYRCMSLGHGFFIICPTFCGLFILLLEPPMTAGKTASRPYDSIYQHHLLVNCGFMIFRSIWMHFPCGIVRHYGESILPAGTTPQVYFSK